jgi:hypothetical protein
MRSLCRLNMRLLFLILFLSLSVNQANGQDKKYKQVNHFNINEIESPFQFSFLNNPPKTRLDSLVLQILKENENSQDSIVFTKLIDSIGMLQTSESYCLLYNVCCRPTLNRGSDNFKVLAGIITYYGGYHTLNKYYLKNEVAVSSNEYIFMSEVIKKCVQNEPECYFQDKN